MKQTKYKEKIWVLKELEYRPRRAVAINYYYNNIKRYSKNKVPFNLRIRRIERLFMDWEYLRDNFGMKRLKETSGNRTNHSKGKRKININDLNENDRKIYQEIMEEILIEHQIPKSIIRDKMKKKKENINNKRGFCEIANISKSSFYYKKTYKTKEFYINPKLIKQIKSYIKESRDSAGRDTTYNFISKTTKVNSYEFRRNWELLNYKSNYHLKYNRKPRERKYKGIWTTDKVKFNFKTKKLNQIWYSDISYQKINNEWYMIFLIKDGFNGKVHYLKLIENRKAITIIKIVNQVAKRIGSFPEIFHTDHGVEYANHKFKKFLEKHGVVQSMSPKGISLANRPAEFFFSCLKREFIYPFLKSIKTKLELVNILKDYLYWYHNYRLQSNLQNKTPNQYLIESRQTYVS